MARCNSPHRLHASSSGTTAFKDTLERLFTELQGQLLDEHQRLLVEATAVGQRTGASVAEEEPRSSLAVQGSASTPPGVSPQLPGQLAVAEVVSTQEFEPATEVERRSSVQKVLKMQMAARRASLNSEASEEEEKAPTPKGFMARRASPASPSNRSQIGKMQQAAKLANFDREKSDDEEDSDSDRGGKVSFAEPAKKGVKICQVEDSDDEEAVSDDDEDSYDRGQPPPAGRKSISVTSVHRGSTADGHINRTFQVLEVWSAKSAVRQSMHQPKKFGAAAARSMVFDETLAEGEEDEEKRPRWFMIWPNSWLSFSWEVLGMMLLSFDCIMIPVAVMDPPSSVFTDFVVWWSLMFLTFNILVSFVVGYVKDDGTVEMRPWPASKRYLQTWFTIDVSIVLLDWLQVVGASAFRHEHALRGVRMIRMVRVVKAMRVIQVVTERIRSEGVIVIATIARLIALMLVANHLLACTWYAVGSAVDRGWVSAKQLEHESFFRRYVDSYHWSLALFAGEHLIETDTDTEKVVTVLVLFSAIIGSAAFVSSLTTAMTRLQIITSEQASQMSTLRRYLADRNISHKLAKRVQQNAQHAIEENKRNMSEHNVELLRLISQPIMMELHFEIYSPILLEHPFFELYNEVNPGGIRKVSHSGVSFFMSSPGDVLFVDMEVPQNCRMFFVVNGSLSYQTKDFGGQEKKELARKGTWLSEAVLWLDWAHMGTARAGERSCLLQLDADAFQKVCCAYPSDHARIYAQEFTQALNDDKEALTDFLTLEDQMDYLLSTAFPELDEASEESDVEDLGSDEDEEQTTPTGKRHVGFVEDVEVKHVEFNADSDRPGSSLRKSGTKKRTSTRTGKLGASSWLTRLKVKLGLSSPESMSGRGSIRGSKRGSTSRGSTLRRSFTAKKRTGCYARLCRGCSCLLKHWERSTWWDEFVEWVKGRLSCCFCRCCSKGPPPDEVSEVTQVTPTS
eukprot:TRINITY_DN16696_c0_g2_i3.p1 TRINITY_DN16696_c0_g2~~TRINITY_DN16696_c0_g2_i3.p1  ORF type:complete len:963 (+),score=210.73 TRINITY_DN16696_c0_g2_i3:32-2920(+)